jgi:hypothetical protein
VLMCTNHELRRVMGINAIEASKKYDIQTTTRQLVEHYEQLVVKAKRRHKSPRYRLARFLDRFQ